MELPFAKVTDLESRWRPLTPEEQIRAEALLMDASVKIANQEGVAYEDTEPESIFGKTLTMITCEMVKRAMMSPIDQASVTSVQQTSGPYSGTLSYANPTADLYLTSSEKKDLGIGKQRIGSIRPAIHGAGEEYELV